MNDPLRFTPVSLLDGELLLCETCGAAIHSSRREHHAERVHRTDLMMSGGKTVVG